MRKLNDVLDEGYAKHVRALDDAGRADVVGAWAVVSTRRRRAWRGTAVGAVSLAAVGALGFAASALPLGLQSARPGAAPTVTTSALPTGAPEWCALASHPAPNVNAWGPAAYFGRVYADYAANNFVYVAPDGKQSVLEPGADGTVGINTLGQSIEVPGTGPSSAQYQPSEPEAFDFIDHASGGTPFTQPGVDPALGYEWTTVADKPVPKAVTLTKLAAVHMMSLGLTASGLTPEMVGADAVVDTVARYADGTEMVSRIAWGQPGARVTDFDGLVSVSTRVTWPSGQTYEITSAYDALKTYAVACRIAPTTSAASEAAPPTGASDATQEGSGPQAMTYGPYLTGPESAVFACGRTLPEAAPIDAADITFEQGEFYDDAYGVTMDFGSGGYAIHTDDPVFNTPDLYRNQFPGWGGNGWGAPPAFVGTVTFDAILWVDSADAIVARQVFDGGTPYEFNPRPEANPGFIVYLEQRSDTQARMWWTGPIQGTAVGCDGVSQQAVEAAAPVILHGYGSDTASMTWQTFRP